MQIFQIYDAHIFINEAIRNAYAVMTLLQKKTKYLCLRP